jgi:RNA polymerase sigma-70 factor (ECF subfamily)
MDAEPDPAGEEAFLCRHREIAPALITWARVRLAGPARRWIEPEEFAQEVWVRALTGQGTYDPERGPFRAWVFGIATNLMIEVLRQVGRFGGGRRSPRDPTTAGVSRVMDQATAVSRRVARDEFLRAFSDHVATLPEDERTLLIFRGLEGLSHQEVADRMGTTREAVMKRWQRLRERLMTEALPPDLLVT